MQQVWVAEFDTFIKQLFQLLKDNSGSLQPGSYFFLGF